MAILRIPADDRVIRDPQEIRSHLDGLGITYERWEPAHTLPPGAPPEEVLAAYAREINALEARGGYVTADVIDLDPDMPNLEEMLAKFEREHWHDEDEVRFILEGSGLFHIRPRAGPVVSVETVAGDLVCVPRGTWHWFHLCPERRIRAIRLFQDPAGWSPHYTDSGVDRDYEPVCLGPGQVAVRP